MMNGRTGRIEKIIERIFVAVAVFAVCFIVSSGIKAYAAAVTVKEVNYDTSEITVTLGSADTVLLISDSKAKKWEIMAEKESGSEDVSFDISWIAATKDYVITLKGDASTDVVKLTLPKQVSNFKAQYYTADSTVAFTNQNGRAVEWKKKEGYTWNTYNADSFASQVENLCANGASLIFRLAGVNGTAGNAGQRPSKEISLTIPKKTAAPVVTIDDNSLTIPLAKGTQYRYLESEAGNPVVDSTTGNYMEWITIPKTDSYALSEIAPKSLYSEGAGDPEETYVQFRTMATSSKQMSNTTTITVPEQQLPLDEIDSQDDNQIELKYTSSTTFKLTVKCASATEPYQYCVVDAKTYGTTSLDAIDPTDVEWKDITSTTAVTFDKTKDKIEEGTKIYVRKKAVFSQGNADYKLASPYINVTGDGVAYPGDATVISDNGILWLQTVAGVCNSSNSDGTLVFQMYSPTETTIKSIKFVDYDNLTDIGSVSITSSVAKNTDAEAKSDVNKKYIITTKIKSTESINSHTETRMLAYITYESGSTFKSTKTEGLGLYIYPATKIDNPTDKTEKTRVGKIFNPSYDADTDYVDYSTAFKRVYLSNKVYDGSKYNHETEDRRDFKFILKLGTVYKKEIGKLSSTPNLEDDVYSSSREAECTVVDKIKYDSVELTPDCYTIQYATDKSSDDKDVRIALVTIHCDKVESNTKIDDRNKDTNLVIYLNTGEVLSDAVTLNLVKTATIDASPVSWSLTPSTLETERTVTTTAANGSTSTTTEKVYSYIIEMTLFNPTYSVAISEVTWNGISVYDKADVGSGKIKLYLSNEKLKNITGFGDSATYNLVITFTNGFVISDDCTMTLLNR